MDTIDFLSVGDITVDDFIKLKTAHTHRAEGEANTELCLTFGDKIEYELHKVVYAVANSSNAAISAARLGLRTAFVTDAGDDEHGRQCADVLKQNRVMSDFVRLHKGLPTNYHYVLWFDTERTILVKHQAYPYTFPALPKPPRWMYLSSIGGDSLDYHREIAAYLAANPETQLAFQPGTFQMQMGTDILAPLYHRAKVFFCNVEEAQRILKSDNRDLKILLQQIRNLGPEIAVITDGENGAYAYDGKEGWFMPIYPAEVYERTGAGDAFSSTFTAALAMGKSVPDALRWGPVNSASVVQYIGAQEGLLTREKLEERLGEAPTDFQPQKFM